MSETPTAAPAEAVSGPAINAEVLPPQLRKHVDPKAPVPLRAMGAKLMVPMSPADAACVLYLLSFDADASVRELALKSAAALPDKIATTALRDDALAEPVLAFLVGQLHAAKNEKLLEIAVTNAGVPDDALVPVVKTCSAKLVELIGQNQLRMLRSEPLLRAVLVDSAASPATRDGIADFAVRSGVMMTDVPALVDAHHRIHGGKVAPAPPPKEETAEDLLAEFEKELSDEPPPKPGAAAAAAGDAPAEEKQEKEKKRLTLTQRVQRMSVAEKIKLATRGNKEARTLLLRDSNKLVAVAAASSPRITQGEIMALTNSKTIMPDVMNVILRSRDWMRVYTIKYNLVRNPKTPPMTAMKLLQTLHIAELKDLQKDRNVSGVLQNAAKALVIKMQPK